MTGTENKCNTCGWLQDTANRDHREHYMVCGWVPSEPLPSNVLSDETAKMSGWVMGSEYRRFIPRAQLDPQHSARRYLRSCPAWKAKA